MYDYLNALKELEQKGTNYLIKLNLLNNICNFDINGVSDDLVDMLYDFYMRSYCQNEYEFICDIVYYCDDNDKTICDLSYEELYEYFGGEN